MARTLRQTLPVHCIVIHPKECAAAISDEGYVQVEGPYCKEPVLTTGAGDNFNAGFCYAWSQGLPMQQCLLCGVSESGYYVRNGESPDSAKLCLFLKQWSAGALDQ